MKVLSNLLLLCLLLSPTVSFAYDDLCADANDDSVVNVKDALMILQHSVELPSLCVTNTAACDVDGTGVIDVNDALDTLRQVVGYIFEMNCPFPVVIHASNVSGTTPLGGIDFLLTYPASKGEIISNCDFGAGVFGVAAFNSINPNQTRLAMITIPSAVLPADIVICAGYGHAKTLSVTSVLAFDFDFSDVPVDVVVVPNMFSLP